MSGRRTNGEGSIRKRNDGLYEGIIRLPNGSRKSVYGKTQKLVKEKMMTAYNEAVIEAAREKNTYYRMTFGEWADLWLVNYARVKVSTQTKYFSDIRLHIKPKIGHVLLGELTTLHLQQLYKWKEDQGFSLKSIKNLHSLIHCILDQAMKDKIIPSNVSEFCNLQSPPKQKMHVIGDDNLGKFLSAIRGHEYESLWYVMIFTGLRRSEAIGLTWDCVDFSSGQIYVYRQWSKLYYTTGKTEKRFEPLKNNRTRIIKPAKQVMTVLRDIRRAQNEMKLRCGAGYHSEYDFVFTKSNGLPYNGDTVFRHFKVVVRSIGLGDTRLHDLRHTYATLALQNGTDVKTVSDSLGHSTTAFTMDQYGHVTDQMRNECASRMEKLIESL